MPTVSSDASQQPLRRLLRLARLVPWALTILLLSAWPVLALFFDFNVPRLRIPAAMLYLAVLLLLLLRMHGAGKRLLAVFLCFALVLAWWLRLEPSNSGNWQPDVSRTASAETHGSQITFQNVRSCDYRAELDYNCQWLTRAVDLDQVRGVDIFMNYWGSPLIAHTIVSFDIGPSPSSPGATHIAFSIEARKQAGQSYSSIRGFFRQYTLISVVSDERDLVRLRTNYRHGEDLYLYHTHATPGFARSLLQDYAAMTNQLQQHPQWYNAVTRNCTTEIFTLQAMKTRPRDWRILFNGKADAMLYDQGELATDLPGSPAATNPIPFAQLKRLASINSAARAADQDPAFSLRIRENRPGFTGATPPP